MGTANSLYAGDYNGDGCTDFLTQGTNNQIVFYCQPINTTAAIPALGGVALVRGDFNGDGMTDMLVIRSSANARLYLATATGLTSAISIGSSSSWYTYTVVAGDWDGDGKTDIALLSKTANTAHVIYQSKGNGFVQLTTVPNTISPAIVNGVVADWNNDGADDIWVKPSSGYDNTLITLYTNVVGATTVLPELITKVSNGIGASFVIAYDRLNKNGSFYTKNTDATYPTGDLVGPYYVVSETDASDGIGGTHNTTYTYTGAKADLTSPPLPLPKTNLAGTGFLSFKTIKKTDVPTSLVTTTTYKTEFPFSGLAESEIVKLGNLTLSSVSNVYSSFGQGGLSQFPHITHRWTNRNDLDGTAFPEVQNAYGWDLYGNLETITTWLTDGSFTTKTTNEYTNDIENWILGQLTKTDVNNVLGLPGDDCDPPTCLTRHYSYTTDPATGLTTQAVLEKNVSTCNAGGTSSCTLTADYGIDGFGNRISTQLSGSGITTRTTSMTPDANGEFPASFTDALNHDYHVTYDPRFGGQTSQTDPNGVRTTTDYDTFGRVKTVAVPYQSSGNAQNWTNIVYTACTNLPAGESCPQRAAYDAIATPQHTPSTQNGAINIVFYDSLGRVVANDVQGLGGDWIRSEILYDGNGNVYQRSRPYFRSGGTAVWTTYVPDVLGRTVQILYPDTNSDFFCYKGLKQSVTNANQQVTTTVLNGVGLVASVQQNASVACGTVNPTTTYSYDAFGNPLTIAALSRTITNTFDRRGRKVTSNDPNMGSWSFDYDVLDQLTQQTDAKGQLTTLGYDKLMRPTSRTEADLTTSWTFDTRPNGVGLPNSGCTAATPCNSSAPYWRQLSYDTLSRVNKSALNMDGTEYDYVPTYNSDGRLDTLTYPSGLVAKYVYDSYGYLTQIQDQATSVAIWTANKRDAELRLTKSTAGNSVITKQTFDANTGAITSICASMSGGTCGGEFENQTYGWDPIGNLQTRSDTVESWSERFCYDGYNRLTDYSLNGSTCTSGSNQKTIGYLSGDMTRKTDVCDTAGCMNYGESGAGPDQLTSISGTYAGITTPKFDYDANGNMRCMRSPSQNCNAAQAALYLAWTSYNMAASITQGSTSVGLAYGSEHQRYKMCNPNCTSPTSTTLYLYDPATGGMSEKTGLGPGAIWRDYIIADGQIVAVRSKVGISTPTWRYVVGDHLDSVTTLTDTTSPNPQVVERDSYDAWGKRRNPDGTDTSGCTLTSVTTRGFTDHEMLDQFCLVNMNARVYDPRLGRFLSADTFVSNPFDFNGYNRYGYLRQNPLNATDPTGHSDQTEVVNVVCDLTCQNQFRMAFAFDDFSRFFESNEIHGTNALGERGGGDGGEDKTGTCQLSNGRIVNYQDAGGGYVFISPLTSNSQSTSSSSTQSVGVAVGQATVQTGLPTQSKVGGIAGGGASGPVTSFASRYLRELTGYARLPGLESLTGTSSIGGSIGRSVPVLGTILMATNFARMQSALDNAPTCTPVT